MTIRRIAALALFLLPLLGCSSEDGGPGEGMAPTDTALMIPWVRMIWTDGGGRHVMAIDRSGRIEVDAHARTTTANTARLEALLTGCDFLQLPMEIRADGAYVADGGNMTITAVVQERPHEVTVYPPVTHPEVAELVRYLQQLAAAP